LVGLSSTPTNIFLFPEVAISFASARWLGIVASYWGDVLSSARRRCLVVDLDEKTCRGGGLGIRGLVRALGAWIELFLSGHYTAISYVWGGLPNLHNRVWFEEGGSLFVTDSAAMILKKIIALNLEAYYWIDALCINQKDEQEKSFQVPLMYDIYSSSEKVLVFAGEESEDSEAALKFLMLLARHLQSLSYTETSITIATLTKMTAVIIHLANGRLLVNFLTDRFSGGSGLFRT
jgi:hypothetical protein